MNHRIWIVPLVLLILTNVEAKILTAPIPCAWQDLTLQAQADFSSSSKKYFELLKLLPDWTSEEYEVSENGLSIPIEQISLEEIPMFILTNDSIHLRWQCRSGQSVDFQEANSSRKKFSMVNSTAPSMQLRAVNYSINPQQLTLKYLDKFSRLLRLEVIHLNSYMFTETIEIPRFRGIYYIEFEASLPWMGVLVDDDGKKILKPIDLPKSPIGVPGVHYFEISNGENSYVLPLSAAQDIAEARDIIAKKKHKIVSAIARVSEASGRNWNMLSPFKTPWSWEIQSFTRFADFGSTECNGNAEMLEVMLSYWRKDISICFWSYKLTRELSVDTGH